MMLRARPAETISAHRQAVYEIVIAFLQQFARLPQHRPRPREERRQRLPALPPSPRAAHEIESPHAHPPARLPSRAPRLSSAPPSPVPWCPSLSRSRSPTLPPSLSLPACGTHRGCSNTDTSPPCASTIFIKSASAGPIGQRRLRQLVSRLRRSRFAPQVNHPPRQNQRKLPQILAPLRPLAPQQLHALRQSRSSFPPSRPSGWPISVSSATVRVPAASAVATISAARYSQSSTLRRNAPDPVFTSSTSASSPAASFLLKIDAQIRPGFSTVPVRSRSAYSFRSAGASWSVCPMIDAPHFLNHRLKLGQRQRCPVAGNRLQLVQRPAGVAQRAPADHRHGHAARRRQRRHQKACLVPHSARRVLVDRLLAQPRRGELLARVAHRQRQRARLAEREPSDPRRHQPRRKFCLRDRPVRRARRYKRNLARLQLPAIPLLADDVDHVRRRKGDSEPVDSNRCMEKLASELRTHANEELHSTSLTCAYIIRYSVRSKVQSAGTAATTQNSADLLSYGRGRRACAGLAQSLARSRAS